MHRKKQKILKPLAFLGVAFLVGAILDCTIFVRDQN